VATTACFLSLQDRIGTAQNRAQDRRRPSLVHVARAHAQQAVQKALARSLWIILWAGTLFRGEIFGAFCLCFLLFILNIIFNTQTVVRNLAMEDYSVLDPS
jgi:hypothetical protein